MATESTAPHNAGDTLLPIARAAISTALGCPQEAAEDARWLKEPGASFVTLTQQGALRGCIGTLEAHRTLLPDVRANAVSAALPLAPPEVPKACKPLVYVLVVGPPIRT